MKKVDIFNFLISYIGIGVMFILTIVRAKVFTVEEIGMYSYIISIALIFSNILSFGSQRIILRYYPFNKSNDFLKKILGIQIIIFIIFVIFYNFLSKLMEMDYIIFIILLSFNIMMMSSVDMISIVTNKSAKSNLYQKIYLNFLDLFVLGIFFLKTNNIFDYLFMYIIVKYIILFLMFFLIKADVHFKIEKKIENIKLLEYYKYGLFIVLNSGASILISTIDKIMLKNYIDFVSVGIYTVALTVGSVIRVVGDVFSRSLSPKISQLLAEKDYFNLEQVYKENAKQQIYIGLFLLVCLTIFSKEILGLMGKEYVSGNTVLVLIAIGQMINIGAGMCGNIISLSKHYKYEAYFNIFLLVVIIGTNMLFIPIYGMLGAAFATALTLILINVIKIVFVYKKFKIHPYRLENYKFIIAGIVIIGIFYIVKQIITLNIIEIGIVSIIVFGVYDGVLYLLKERDVLSLKVIRKIL